MDLLRHLRYFLAVCEERHFGRAAERLGMAQPPLSQRIRRLETELGVRLFDRDPRGVRLTDAGRVLMGEAPDLLNAAERAVDRTRRAHAGEIGTLTAGVPTDLPGRSLAAIVAAFESRRPELGLDLWELTTTEQLRLLAEKRLDTGLVRLPADITTLEVLTELSQPLGVVLPRDAEPAARAEIALAELAGFGLVTRPREAAPGFHDDILTTCRDHGFTPTGIHHAQNPEFLLGLVLAGRGICFDTGEVARKEARAVWRPIAGDVLRARSAVVSPARHAHPAAMDFAEAVRDALGTSPPSGTVADRPDRPWNQVFGRD